MQKYLPQKELEFMAKFGFLTRGFWEKHFSKRSRTRNYRVWKRLIEEKYFEPNKSKLFQDVVYLGSFGRKVLWDQGRDFVTPSNPFHTEHDEIVAEIALGLIESKLIDKFETESEIKKRLMSWSKSREGRGTKFPDLLLYCPQFDKPIALELEVSMKSSRRYQKAMESYRRMQNAELILFVSQHQKIFSRLSHAMKKVYFPTWEKPVGYVELNDLLKNKDQAKVYFADKQCVLTELCLGKKSENAAT